MGLATGHTCACNCSLQCTASSVCRALRPLLLCTTLDDAWPQSPAQLSLMHTHNFRRPIASPRMPSQARVLAPASSGACARPPSMHAHCLPPRRCLSTRSYTSDHPSTLPPPQHFHRAVCLLALPQRPLRPCIPNDPFDHAFPHPGPASVAAIQVSSVGLWKPQSQARHAACCVVRPRVPAVRFPLTTRRGPMPDTGRSRPPATSSVCDLSSSCVHSFF